MKPIPLLLAVLSLAIVRPPSAEAQPRSIAAPSAERALVAVTETPEPYLRDGETVVPLELPFGTRIATVEALAGGWIVTGTTTYAESQTLFLLVGRSGRTEEVPVPPGITSRFAAAPAPLIESGELAGLAWLEGERYDAYAVRSAAWDGTGWSDAVTVSEADLPSQLALAGDVLSDGSWLLAWSAVADGDDEIFWARREVTGSWRARERLTADNRVPDIHPAVRAQPAAGALVSWSRFDGNDYRVRMAALGDEDWRELDFSGPRGSFRPRLVAGERASYLLYRRVVPDEWVVEELDAGGRAWRRAAAPVAAVDPPMVAADENGVVFSWPLPVSPAPAATLSAPGIVTSSEGSSVTASWELASGDVSGGGSLAARILPGPLPSMAEPGAVVYRAFGDSIMRASSDPLFMGSFIFDVEDDDGEYEFPMGRPECAPNGDPFAILCGVNWRLEDALDATFPSDVANDGYGAEKTPAGLTRLDSILAAGGDVLLLMEGTNDITQPGTSNTTILENLGKMVDKATAAGWDTGLASVIKRRKVDSSGNPMPDSLNETQTANLRNSIHTTLAPSKNRVHIDAWMALNPALGQIDYWDAIGNGDCCGHPDATGYDKLETKFRDAILADPVLDAPVPVGPTGNTGQSPTFTWNPTVGARLYQLSVTGPGGTTATWYDALPPPMPPLPPGVNYASCSGTCSASLTLPVGSHTWKVRGKNLRGAGPFSAAQAFEVHNCGALPADIFLDGTNSGSQTHHACPGSVTSQAGFVVSSGETVTLWGTTSVVIEEIVVENATTLTLRSD